MDNNTNLDRQNYKYWREEGGWWRAEYERRMSANLLYPIQTVVISALVSGCAPGMIAEFGCGTGRHLEYIIHIDGIKVIGIDQSAAMLEAIEQFAGIDWCKTNLVLVEPTGRLPFADNYFDVIFTCESLVHVNPADLKGRLAELIRIARKGTFHLEPAPGYEIDEYAHSGSWNHDIVGASIAE